MQIALKLHNLIKWLKKKCQGKTNRRPQDCRLIQLFLPHLEDELRSVLGGMGSTEVDLEAVLHKSDVRAQAKLPLLP